MAGGAAIGGGITAALQSFADYGMQQLSANRSKKEAKRAREHQLYMRSTAYQATMADMRSAGLNPMLAYSAGPTAGGHAAMGSGGGGSGGTSAGAAFGAAHSAISSGRLREQQRHQSEAQTDFLDSGISKNEAEEALLRARTLTEGWSAKNLAVQNRLMNFEVPSAAHRSQLDQSLVGMRATRFQHLVRKYMFRAP